MSAGLQRLLLRLLSPPGRRARLTVFTFHRTPETPDALLAGEPDAATFRQMLAWIAGLCRVLPLEEAVRALADGSLPERAAVITFDDGYRNNLTVAKPALVEAGLPATVFIAVDPVRRGYMWNDLIIDAVRGAAADVDLEDLRLGVLRTGDDQWREIERLIGLLKYRDYAERLDVAEEVYRRSAGTAPPRQMLTEDEVLRLAGDGITLGAHTVNHPILTRLDDRRAEQEITESRSWLGEITGAAPALFAYPNGRPGDDYDARHVAMVERAGFAAAMSTRWAAATAASPRFELPRYTPWERKPGAFGARILKTCAASYLGR